MKLKQVFAGVLMAALAMGSLAAKAEIAAESEEGSLDLTIGDRVAKATEALVVDPVWGDVDAAELLIDGEESARTYSAASIDAWETAALEPGRYVVALEAGELVEQAAFWKLGEDWVVLDNETITENVTFESGKTYLVFGTNLIASGVTLTVTDGAKFFYDESAPAGFQTAGGSLNELPKRYKIADGLDPADETKFCQIVEKIHGCEDNPWAIGAEGEVVAWTNGTELVVAGAGTIGALDENAELAALLDGLTGLTIVDAGVTAGADAFAALAGDASVALTLPDGWQGEFPDEDGNWYGAMVELTALPFTIRNVVFAQRWPWNGMVDVAFDLTGSEGEQNLIVKVRDGETEIANFNTTVTIPVDGVANGVRVVWNAAAADLDASFRSNDITIEVTKTTLADGQLWEGGPIWSDCNIGGVKPGDYGDLVDGNAAAGAVTTALGAGWRLPTGDEITALIANSSTNWVTCENSEGNSVYGCLFTSKVDLSKSVFVPCAGTDRSDGKGRVEVGTDGYNWSSTLLGKKSAWYLRLMYDETAQTPVAVLGPGTRDNKMSVRAVRDAESPVKSIVKGMSVAGTVDLRANIALVEGETTVSNVMWSATAWGELDESFTTVGYTNLTTGATGEFGNLANIMGEGVKDVVLPQQDGDYMFTHTQGGFVSFATFTVTGYPLGCVTNPWEIGAGDDPASVTAVRDGDGIVVNPVRGVATREGLETIVDALGGTEFPVGLVSADGTATNELVLLVGSDGKGFPSLGEALASDADSFMLYEIAGPTVSLPAGLEGMTLVVSNLTDGVEIPASSSVPGGADYVLPYGASIAVYAVPAEDYELVDGTNPIMVDEVTFETTVDASVLPTAANLTAAKEVAKAAIDEALGEEPSEEVLALADAAKAAIDEAATLADIATAQQDGLDTIVVQQQAEAEAAAALAVAKDEAKTAVDEALGEEPSEEVLALAEAAKAAIDAAATLDDVATAQQDGLDAIAAQQQAEAEAAAALAAAKDEAKTTVEDALGEEPSEAVLALADAAKSAIDAAESQEALSAVLDDALTAIAAQLAADAKRKAEYLYPEGDGAFVAPKKATQYLGSFVTVDGKVNGTVLVKMTKPGNKTGLANIAATITTLDRKSLIFKAKKVDVAGSTDGVFVLAPVNVRAKEMGDLSIVISGDSLMGTLPDGQGVDAARNVFKDRKDPKCGRIAPFVGDWTLALDVDGGLLPLTMRVANSGSVRLSGKFASGKTFSASVNSVVGDGWICAPVAVVKASDGKNVEVAFAVAFREGTGTIEIVRSSNIELVAVGKPVSDKKTIKAKTVTVEGMGAPVKQSVNYTANTGKLTGSAQWKDGNKSVKAKLFGVEIDGVMYGNAVINKTSHPFTLQ